MFLTGRPARFASTNRATLPSPPTQLSFGVAGRRQSQAYFQCGILDIEKQYEASLCFSGVPPMLIESMNGQMIWPCAEKYSRRADPLLT
jgi:hypothetical protein